MKLTIRILTFFSVIALVLGFFSLTFAAEISNPDSESGNSQLQENSVVNDNYITAGNSVSVNGTVNGDVIVAGNEVEITSNINGNVFAAASVITISGKVSKDVFAFAGTVKISKDSVINGDLIIGAGNVIIAGEIKGNLKVSSGSTTINGKIAKDVKNFSNSLTLESSSLIAGNLTYSSNKEIKIDNGAQVLGKTEQKQIDNKGQITKNLPVFGSIAKVTGSLFSLLSMLLIGIILLTVFSKKLEDISKNIQNKFWMSLGVGFLTLVVVPIALMIIFSTIIGIPLTMIILAIYVLSIYLAKVFVALALGNMIVHNRWSAIWALTLGLILLTIFELIPFIGGFVSFLILLVGLGGISLLIFGKKQNK